MKKAFSLMELLIVVIILGLLATFLLPNLTAKSEESKVKISCIQMSSIAQTLKMYKIDTSLYPSTSEGLKLLQDKNYFDENKMPKDAWSNEFIYTKNNDMFELISFGGNKIEGGDDDIYYSKCLNK